MNLHRPGLPKLRLALFDNSLFYWLLHAVAAVWLRNRTTHEDTCFRKPLLYPSELQGHKDLRAQNRIQDATNQLLQLREFCAKQGWKIVTEYIDKASGKHSDREQFQKMFAAASRREFDLVLFWSLDRFSREGTVETLQHLQRLTAYGVAWRSFTEQ
jgi:hypothetical protein